MKASRFTLTVARLSLGLFVTAVLLSSCRHKGTCPAYGGQVLPEKKAVWALMENVKEIESEKKI
ncbi:MAG: hypothetical protein ACOZCO_12125 [Bacteroidota bacterium]